MDVLFTAFPCQMPYRDTGGEPALITMRVSRVCAWGMCLHRPPIATHGGESFEPKDYVLNRIGWVADKPTILHWCCVSTMCGLRARDTHTMRDTKGHSGFWKSQRISWETEDEKASGTLFLFHQLDNALMCYGKRMQKCRLWKWLFQEDGYAILVLPECLFTQKVCHFLLSRGGCCEVGFWLCFVVYVMWRCVYIQSWVKRICSSSLHSPLNMIMMCHLFKKRLRSAS